METWKELRDRLYPVKVAFTKLLLGDLEYEDNIGFPDVASAEVWIKGVEGHPTIRDARMVTA